MNGRFADTLGIQIIEKPFLDEKRFPIFLRNEYDILQGEVENVPCLLLKKSGNLNLAQMKKHMSIVTNYTDIPCVFVLDVITDYQKKRLVELHISFIVPGKQLYMPFLGVALRREYRNIKKPVQQISFAAQKIVLLATYGKWGSMTVTEVARLAGYSKMTVSRCLDELEGMIPGCVTVEGRNRCLSLPSAKTVREQYDFLKPFLRSPVRKVISLFDIPLKIKTLSAGGFSALSEYTMLADNAYPTYAVTKNDFRQLEKEEPWKITPDGEDPKALLEVWEYLILLTDKKLPDPISLAISFRKRGDSDDRTKMAIEKMLEEYAW